MNKFDVTEVERKIFVVDDEEDNLKLLNNILIRSGYAVESFFLGETVLKACEADPPDLILLDINLPDMDGYQVCNVLKLNNQLKDIPVIFISGLSDTKEKVEAFNCGGVDYLTKPFSAAELRSRIKIHLEINHDRQVISTYADQLQKTIDDMSTLFETGTLVANVVHDTKKFTTAMTMMLESIIIPALKEKLDTSEDWVNELLFNIGDVHSNSIQCTDFLESLLSINRKGEDLEPVDIIKIIHQSVNLISYNLIQEGIQWEIECDQEKELMVMGNGQLVRVFINLIVNAMDALKKHGTANPKIMIKIETVREKVRVSVIDNGKGIKKEVLEGIRKGMILSTKGKAGNGFGVSGLTRIVKNLNGTIHIDSVVGRGATFAVTLQRGFV